MHFDIENKYYDELENMKNPAKGKMSEKFLERDIEESEKGQYFGEVIGGCEKVFGQCYDSLNFKLKVIKDEIIRINEQSAVKEEQKMF
jgi:hypothetical protein